MIGVVGTVRNPPLSLRPRPEVYVPWAAGGEVHLLADTQLDRPLALAAELAATVRTTGLGEPLATVRSTRLSMRSSSSCTAGRTRCGIGSSTT